MITVLPRVYFGNIAFYSIYNQAQTVSFDPYEHFLKQSYRNRCTIISANSKQNLIVPINRRQRKEPIENLEISYAEDWQRVHLGGIISSYQASPFYEHYAHLFESFYKEFKPKTLWELNKKAHEIVKPILGIEKPEIRATEFVKNYAHDFRNKCKPNDDFNRQFKHRAYLQVFEERHGFQINMSILDLVFNEGPNSSSFL